VKRLTEQRVTKWVERLERAEKAIANVRAEQREHVYAAKGGRYSQLVECVSISTTAMSGVTLARITAESLLAGEQRRSGGAGRDEAKGAAPEPCGFWNNAFEVDACHLPKGHQEPHCYLGFDNCGHGGAA
jgi:hypothetical protein